MKCFRLAAVLLSAALLLLIAGCLELVGQRITLRHDVAKDELHIMLHYDGVHDSGNNQYGDGAEQVAAAIRNGEFMLLDWPFHVQPEAMKNHDGNEPQPIKDFIALAGKSLKVRTIGYHRDPDGRIGGSQLITITGAKAFIRSANAAFSSYVLAEGMGEDERLPRTAALIIAAAKADHQWLSLDGHALKVSVPVHPREWAAVKAKALAELAQEVARDLSPDDNEQSPAEKTLLKTIAALCSAPVSYSDAQGMVTITLGDAKTPSTVRIELNKIYQPNLVDSIKQSAPADVDEVMARLLTGQKPDRNAELAEEIIKWGPPEEKVRGLMRMIKADDPDQAAKAAKALESFARKWNETEGIPQAPAAMADTDEYLAAWTKWYEAALRFPLKSIQEQ